MSYKLLLADDSITIQKVVGIIFANEDYELTVVDNGTLAIEKAKELAPDIILIDALMPGKTGYEVCEEVRRDNAIGGTPLLLLTGAFEPFDEGKAKSSGADDFISKPFESQHLIEKVKKLIELGKTRKKQQPAAPTVAPTPQQPIQPKQQTPAPPVQSKPQPQPVPAAPAAPKPAPAPVSAAADIFFEEPNAEGEVLSADAFIIEEAEPEDDLWGAIATDKAAADDSFAFDAPGESPSPFSPEPDPFIFDEEKAADEIFSGSGAIDEFSEEPFIFEDESAKADTASFASGPREFDFEEPAAPITLKSPTVVVAAPSASPSFAASDDIFAIDEEEVPAAPVFVPPTPAAKEVFAPPPAPAAKSAATIRGSAPASVSMSEEPLSLSEEQLAKVVARISREIIEKVAWEVVPDLAESIIKEEIRKIKTGQ